VNRSDAPGSKTGNFVSLGDEKKVADVLAQSVLSLWDAVNNLTRLRPTVRERYRVSIFGSARVEPGTFGYEETKRAAKFLAEMGCDIITGGGPGLMQAANEGAAGAPERSRSYGIRVDLPFEQNVNAFVSQAYQHRTFFTRLHQFVITSDAFVVAPGGIGTVLEMTMIWQLLQVRHLQDVPLILVGKMWPDLIEWAKTSMLSTDPPLANPEDLTIPTCVAGADEAIDLIRKHHATWLATQQRLRDLSGAAAGGWSGEVAEG
jgi:predicted Rossmann-fold nucleotide-binding protein